MQFTIAKTQIDIQRSDVAAELVGHTPEAIQTHWVDVDGTQWPPKQVLFIVTGIARSDFITHASLRIFRRLGFNTSNWPADSPNNRDSTPPQPADTHDSAALGKAVEILARFLNEQDLTTRISTLEHALQNTSKSDVATVVNLAGIGPELLGAATTVRDSLGRINDVIHATTLALLLPLILEDDEVVTNRPSLAAGNDPSRPFDLETNLRIAEIKVAVWKGSDAMRKRGVFADLVHLSLEETTRKKQLFVVGDQPARFLNTTTSTADWGLSRGSTRLRQRFEERYGSTEVTISEFRASQASQVEIVDLAELLPGLLV